MDLLVDLRPRPNLVLQGPCRRVRCARGPQCVAASAGALTLWEVCLRFVDSAGALHLSITNKPASVSATPGWHATEVQLIEERLHYGTYLSVIVLCVCVCVCVGMAVGVAVWLCVGVDGRGCGWLPFAVQKLTLSTLVRGAAGKWSARCHHGTQARCWVCSPTTRPMHRTTVSWTSSSRDGATFVVAVVQCECVCRCCAHGVRVVPWQPTRLDAGQHVIQPFNGAGGLRDVYHTTGLLPTAANLPQTEAYTAVMVWHEDHVQFLTLRGLFETDDLDSIPSGSILRETIAWKETHTIPAPGRAQVRACPAWGAGVLNTLTQPCAQIHINLWQYQGDASFDASTVTPSHVTIPKFQMSAATSLVTPVQSESACRAANWCWCEDVGAGTAMPSCHRYASSCMSPHACTDKPAATCSDAVDDVHYLREANALVSAVCSPGSPWHDNCAMPDVTLHGVDYWLRRGLGPHAEVCY